MSRQSDTIKTQKTWFDNAELSSSKHDEILVWLHAQILSDKKLVNRLFGRNVELVGIEIEFPFRDHKGIALGFADMRVSAKFKIPLDDKPNEFWTEIGHVFIEIKTKVNLGETIRQIKYYGAGPWFVCAPMFDQWEILNSQNIGFIEYKPNGN